MAGMRGLIYLGFIVSIVIGWVLQKFHKDTAAYEVRAELPADADAATLQSSLKDPRWQLRLEAVNMLRHQHSPENLDLLVSVLHDEDSDVREAAVAAILDYGEQSIDGLEGVLAVGNVNSREAAIRILLQLQVAQRIAPLLIDALRNDVSAWVRIPAAQGLGEIGSAQAVSALIKALHAEEHPDVQSAIQAGLRRINTRETRAALASHVTKA